MSLGQGDLIPLHEMAERSTKSKNSWRYSLGGVDDIYWMHCFVTNMCNMGGAPV